MSGFERALLEGKERNELSQIAESLLHSCACASSNDPSRIADADSYAERRVRRLRPAK